jgi:hypothetical protein
MKVTIKLNAYDMMKLANPETEAEVIAQAHNMVTVIFDDRDNMMTATMSLEDKGE